MKTIRLSENDYQVLVLTLGYASGAYLKHDAPIPDATKALIDWVLIQGNESNYTYYNDKNRLRETKEKELAEEGGGVP